MKYLRGKNKNHLGRLSPKVAKVYRFAERYFMLRESIKDDTR